MNYHCIYCNTFLKPIFSLLILLFTLQKMYTINTKDVDVVK